jgi:hypothetical protein
MVKIASLPLATGRMRVSICRDETTDRLGSLATRFSERGAAVFTVGKETKCG